MEMYKFLADYIINKYLINKDLFLIDITNDKIISSDIEIVEYSRHDLNNKTFNRYQFTKNIKENWISIKLYINKDMFDIFIQELKIYLNEYHEKDSIKVGSIRKEMESYNEHSISLVDNGFVYLTIAYSIYEYYIELTKRI